MDSSDVKDLVEDMSGSIDDLEASLAPLLNATLSSSTSKLPLLDKAKLYVLATYAIDSVLFSYLRLNGQNIKEHPVVQEIMRVRSYFNKIKEVEAGPAQRNTTLDKDAAARFIKHGLSGNDKYDQARQERITADKSGAKRKAEEFEAAAQFGSGNRFAGMAKRMKAEEATVPVVKAGDVSDDDEDDEGATISKAERKAAKLHDVQSVHKQSRVLRIVELKTRVLRLLPRRPVERNTMRPGAIARLSRRFSMDLCRRRKRRRAERAKASSEWGWVALHDY